jgi:hypothetical protein
MIVGPIPMFAAVFVIFPLFRLVSSFKPAFGLSVNIPAIMRHFVTGEFGNG